MDSSEQARSADEPEHGTLTVEDDEAGTTDPAELAGTAGESDDADVGYRPASSAADDEA